MSKPANDNILLHGNKPLDAKYGPWPSIQHALAFLEPYMRHVGLTVGIVQGDGSVVDYCWKSGLEDHHLVFKAMDKHLAYPVTSTKYEGIHHNLGKIPSVTILDSQGKHVFADVQHIDQNTTTVSFREYFTGVIVFN